MITLRQTLSAAAVFCALPFVSLNAHALSCSVSADTWSTGYVVNVTVTNDGTSTLNGWNVWLNFDQSPGITNAWNADVEASGTGVTAWNGAWNGNLAVGQSTSFGFQGTHNGNFSLPDCSTGPGGADSSSSVSSESSSSSDVSSSSSSSAAEGDTNRIIVRARGTSGTESITLRVGGTDVDSWTLATAMMDYTVDTALTGDIHVAFTNDNDGDADVEVDYVIVTGVTRQAEDQSENTGAWGNNECGGGSNSEWLHCNGYINFGPVTGGGDTSSSASSSSSSPGGVGSAGCGAPAGLSSGRHSINVAGLNREYILDVPSNYNPNDPYRLVFAWHWRGGSADNVASEQFYGLKGQANGSAIFVAPDRIPADNGWPNTNGRDMEFLRAMLAEFKSELCIDEDRIFSLGWSYGGMMSFAVGREMADTFRAIAPASGALWTPYNDSGLPMAAWITHGTSDSVVGYSSGEEARDLYVQANSCSNTTVPVQPAGCVEYQGCEVGHPVVWCPFNGGHSTPSYYSSAVWQFFSRF